MKANLVKNSRKINTVRIETVPNSAKDRIYEKLYQLLDCETIQEKVFLDLFKKYSPYRIYEALDLAMGFNESISVSMVKVFCSIMAIKRNCLSIQAICENWDIDTGNNDVSHYVSSLGDWARPLVVYRHLDLLITHLVSSQDYEYNDLLVLLDLKQAYFVLHAQLNDWDIDEYLKAA